MPKRPLVASRALPCSLKGNGEGLGGGISGEGGTIGVETTTRVFHQVQDE